MLSSILAIPFGILIAFTIGYTRALIWERNVYPFSPTELANVEVSE